MNLRLRENKREKERSLSENGCVGEREREDGGYWKTAKTAIDCNDS